MVSQTRENSDNIPILTPIVSFHHQLMSSRHQSQAVILVKRLRDILAERVTRSSRGDSPSAAIIRIRPQQIAHRAFVRDFLDTVEGTDVVKRVDTGRQPSVKTEDLIIDEGGKGKVIKEVGEEFPHVGVAVFTEALVVETVDLGDLAGLVVSAQNGDPLGVPNLERNEERHRLDRVVSTVNVIT